MNSKHPRNGATSEVRKVRLATPECIGSTLAHDGISLVEDEDLFFGAQKIEQSFNGI